MKYAILTVLMSFHLAVAFAEVAPSPVASPSVAPVVQTLQAIDGKIPVELAGGILVGLVFLVELLMRVIKTDKPRSLLILVAAVFQALGSIFTKLSGLLDKVVQNTKDQNASAPEKKA